MTPDCFRLLNVHVFATGFHFERFLHLILMSPWRRSGASRHVAAGEICWRAKAV